MNTKTTYIAALTYAIENLTDAPQDVMDKLTALRGQYEDRKNYVPKAKRVEAEKNVEIGAVVMTVLATGEKMTASEILGADPFFAENKISTQKLSIVLRSLKDDGKIVRLEEGRKTFFQMIAE